MIRHVSLCLCNIVASSEIQNQFLYIARLNPLTVKFTFFWSVGSIRELPTFSGRLTLLDWIGHYWYMQLNTFKVPIKWITSNVTKSKIRNNMVITQFNSVLKYKIFWFVLSQTILHLTKFIKK